MLQPNPDPRRRSRRPPGRRPSRRLRSRRPRTRFSIVIGYSMATFPPTVSLLSWYPPTQVDHGTDRDADAWQDREQWRVAIKIAAAS